MTKLNEMNHPADLDTTHRDGRCKNKRVIEWNRCDDPNVDHPPYEQQVLLHIGDRDGCHLVVGHRIHPNYRGKDTQGNQYYWFVDESENTAFLVDEITHWASLDNIRPT